MFFEKDTDQMLSSWGPASLACWENPIPRNKNVTRPTEQAALRRLEVIRFTAEELDDLAKYDAMVDAAKMTAEDYRTSAFVDELIGEDLGKKRRVFSDEEKRRNRARSTLYNAAHKAEIAVKKKIWYQENKARILAQQREYRLRKKALAAT